MCARDVTSLTPQDPIWEELGITPMAVETENYPNRDRLAIRLTPSGAMEPIFMRWGLVPCWATDPAEVKSTFNARAEGIAERPTFRNAYRARRCLLLATGFVEWRSEAGRKRPYLFTVDGGRAYAYAGLWESWGPNESPLLSCSLITTVPNALLSQYHNRMPAILRPEDYRTWVDPRTGPHHLTALLAPFPEDRMTAQPYDCRPDGQGDLGL